MLLSSHFNDLEIRYKPQTGEWVIVSDWLWKRISITTEGLMALVAGINERDTPHQVVSTMLSESLIDNDIQWTIKDREAANAWGNNGWSGSLTYYLWSLMEDYPDFDDPNGLIRAAHVANCEIYSPPRPKWQYVSLKKWPLQEWANAPFLPIGKALKMRRTCRSFKRATLAVSDLKVLIHEASYSTAKNMARFLEQPTVSFYDSFGIGFEFFLFLQGSTVVPDGTYFYEYANDELHLLSDTPWQDSVVNALMSQNFLRNANCILFLCVRWEEYMIRYRHERCLRNIYIDAGRIGQRIIIAAERLGLASFTSPAFNEEEIGFLFGISHYDCCPIYCVAVGHNVANHI